MSAKDEPLSDPAKRGQGISLIRASQDRRGIQGENIQALRLIGYFIEEHNMLVPFPLND